MIKIIPAIDILDGACVRLTEGDYASTKIYHKDPVEVAKRFEAAGIEQIHVVDLDGAKAKHIVNYPTIERLAKATNLRIDFGGGIKTDEDIQKAFDFGAAQVTVGSIATQQPDRFLTWLTKYGAERIILGADFKANHIAIEGWQTQTENTLDDFIARFVEAGVRYTICTDIQKDGRLEGTALDTYLHLRATFPTLNIIASGGVSSMAEVRTLDAMGCYGAIIGKAIYENKITLDEIANYAR